MKVLVTGGAGFIGSHLVDRLLKEGYEVRVLDDLSSGKMENLQSHIESGKVDFVKADIRDALAVKKSMQDICIVVHLAAQASVPFSVEHPDETFDINVKGTVNLLRSAAEETVKKFVFISSCAVYGASGADPISEGTKTDPISPYAESKLLGERYCLGFDERKLFPAVVLRLFNVYGLRQGLSEYSGVITRFIDRLKHNLPLIIYGDGSQTRDFVHVSNVVDAICCALSGCNGEGEIFNIGSGNCVSLKELAATMLDVVHSNVTITFEAPRVGDIEYSCADISKAKRVFGYTPSVQLMDGLAAMFAQDPTGK
jgi:UDP-glucose 4-epimerase